MTRSSARQQRGQALVESALALPVLLLLLLGFYQLAWGFWARLRLQHAAHCSARAYAVWEAKDPTEAQRRAKTAADMALGKHSGFTGLSIEYQGGRNSAEQRSFMEPRQAYQETHRLLLHALLQPAGSGFLWRQGLRMQAPARILAEPGEDKTE